MNKTLAIAAITLVAVVMGMSVVAPAFAGALPVDENPRCDALRNALEKAGSDKAQEAIQEALDRLGCDVDPCPADSSVSATLGDPCVPCPDSSSVPATLGKEDPCAAEP